MKLHEMAENGIPFTADLLKKEYMDSTGAQANTEVNVGNFSKYAHIHKGKYRVISRVSNTIIWIEADNQYQEEIKALLKNIGY